MSVSTRVSIAWPPHVPPAETTDTLVLSFPSNHFIDLRFVKDASPAALDWGFAGRMETTGNQAKFVHLIDSRSPLDPLSVQDSGDFEILPSGDERETGSMLNPSTGKVMSYVEIWRKLSKPAIDGAVCLKSVGDDDVDAWIGRVGTWYQGICVRHGHISAVRRALDEKGSWKDILKVGDDVNFLPIIEVKDATGWSPDQTVTHGGRDWLVVDA
ncbi:hypothetical protein CALVIDRAFT_553841 [Calocera viscosa TUFC12733]|uniref:Protein HRI1 n=1 Tax=Calocera viscosa (strain TUFC12733) TaxID=1330018 RepID=A0A167PAF4_CALVF|nr:hypothetical protein CALVIDRAFT_553841 [Calocera viscosa TUFC12733]